ncbi:MAG: winged helix-turn-helix domain-containing protein [Candidatus Bathyarchaeota archaeon]|jgi:DNA-binding transcriptional ArsR family regulator|nr:winged helix-turn-helix domain-containing protein [Candidatus Bathyarchaeota archaeon]
MTNSEEEEIYSIMFSSLKHPVRRKILRMLSDKPMSFSHMLEELGISSSHLTYHLENLGELVSKTKEGSYQLSKFGEASVDTMKLVEEAPVVRSKQGLSMKWKSIVAILLIVTVFFAGFSVLQYNFLNEASAENDFLIYENNLLEARYQQLLGLSADTDKAIEFIQDVIQFDLSEYHVALLSDTVEFRSDLGGVVEEILRYSLSNSEDKIDVVLRFRNQFLSRYQIYVFEGSPIYSTPQPYNMLDAAANLLERYKLYGNASYLDQMSSLLDMVDEVKNIEIIKGNMKLKISSSDKTTEFFWLYTESGVDFSPKSLNFIFENRALKQLTDGWFLFKTASTEVNVSREEAITLAREAAEIFTWEYEGEIIGNFTILEVPVDAEFVPHPREDFLNLIPYWYVTLYLDRIYPGEVSRIAVGLWGDTGEIADIRAITI